jgi:hypothetical protein
MKKLFKCANVEAICLICLLAGCDNWQGRDDRAREACYEKGGVPIEGSWTDKVTECVFPPRK